MDREPLTESQLGRAREILRELAHAQLGGAPCERPDCSACAKLSGGTVEVAVATIDAHVPSPSPAVPGLAATSYTPRFIPELAFAPEDAQVLSKVVDGIHEDARLWRLKLE